MKGFKNAFFIVLIISGVFLVGCSNTFVNSVDNNTPINPQLTQPTSSVQPIVNTTIPEKKYYVRNNSTTIIFLPESTIIITKSGDAILYGAGSTNELTLLNQVLGENNIQKIKYLILPIPKNDASSYLAIRYKPFIYYTGIPSNFEDFKKYANYSFVDSRKVLDTDLFVEIIPPYENRGLFPDNSGNTLVVKVVDGSNTFLLIDECSALCQKSITETASVLQARNTFFDLDFLTRTNPSTVMNAKNLSTPQLDFLGIKTFTDKKIYAYSDGNSLEVNP